jgi:MFS family permease
MGELWQFYLFYITVGTGTSFVGVVPATTVVSNWFKKRRGWAIGILGTGIGAGAVLLPLVIGAFLIPEFGWRTSYVASGVFVILTITPLSLLIIRQKPEDMGLLADGSDNNQSFDMDTEHGSDSEVGLSLKNALKTRAFWLMALAFFTICTANQALMQNHVPHLSDMGYASRITALALSIVGIGSGIGKFTFGWLCDFIKPKYTLAIGAVFGISSVVVLMNTDAVSSVFMIGSYALMLGLCVGSWLPAMSMNVSRTFGLASYSVIFGAISLIFTFGGALGPTVAGIMYDYNQSYNLAFIISMALYGITIPAILLVSPTVDKCKA